MNVTENYEITKWGHLNDSKWSRHKIETFRGDQDFFGPFNGTRDREGHLGPKELRAPLKVDFGQRTIFNP